MLFWVSKREYEVLEHWISIRIAISEINNLIFSKRVWKAETVVISIWAPIDFHADISFLITYFFTSSHPTKIISIWGKAYFHSIFKDRIVFCEVKNPKSWFACLRSNNSEKKPLSASWGIDISHQNHIINLFPLFFKLVLSHECQISTLKVTLKLLFCHFSNQISISSRRVLEEGIFLYFMSFWLCVINV